MKDEKIIDLYFARDEMAITETQMKYGSYCFSVANNILNNREDSEETVSDTWLRAWTTIPPQRPGVLKMYLAKITRNLAFSAYRTRTAAKRGGGEMELALEELDRCLPSRVSVESTVSAKELGRAVRAFLDTLSEREQNIFIRRYFFVEEIEAIAVRYELKTGNVQKILSRTRQKLKRFLIQEGYDV